MYGHYTSQAAEVGKAIKEQFGELNAHQLWQIVKLAKIIRRSCRNNTAFNSAMSAAFPHARFKQVPKKDERTGREYNGLEISVRIKVNGEEAEQSVQGEDES